MKDLLKDENGDLLLTGNDVVIGTSDAQHQNDLVVTEKGAIKQFPETGVGAYNFLEAEDFAGLEQETALQCSGDGMKVFEVSYNLTTGKLKINARYQ